MDISKILEIGKIYIGDYVNMILAVFTRPRSLHTEMIKNYSNESNSPLLVVPPEVKIRQNLKKFPPQLIVNFFLSIFIGSILHGLNPSFRASGALTDWIIIVSLSWVMYTLVAFALFKVLGGKLYLLDFLAICLQVIASAYIVSVLFPCLRHYFLVAIFFSTCSRPLPFM
jgi:hypothetical protein